jgi:hypothetical protein
MRPSMAASKVHEEDVEREVDTRLRRTEQVWLKPTQLAMLTVRYDMTFELTCSPASFHSIALAYRLVCRVVSCRGPTAS